MFTRKQKGLLFDYLFDVYLFSKPTISKIKLNKDDKYKHYYCLELAHTLSNCSLPEVVTRILVPLLAYGSGGKQKVCVV